MRLRKLPFILTLFALFAVLTSLVPHKVSAVSAADWQAGRIIDDPVFSEAGSMNVSQIQAFLNSLVPNCDTNGTQPASDWGRSDLTHAQFATQVKGWPGPPYVCLKEYYEVPKTSPGAGMPDNSYNHYDASSGTLLPVPGGVSAAQLIYNAAQQYHISPKVLLIKIRSESSGPLTNDTWPLQSQYTYAMGAHCPDSGPNHSANCDPNYAGFSIQISEAAALLRYYLDNMTQSWWPYKKLGVNSIQYNPDPACGSSNVNIVTSATAALYTYTPYQPNAGALAAGYGTAPCGAYGNRNFWLYYRDWFGPTNGSPFFNINGAIYILGANNTYYHVPNPTYLGSYGLATVFRNQISMVDSSFVANMTNMGELPLIARFDSNAIYEFDTNGIHQFSSQEDYFDFGYSFGMEANLPSYLASAYPVGSPMAHVVKQIGAPEIYYVSGGKRQHISNLQAWGTTGSPVYSSRASVQVSPAYVNTLPEGAPIVAEGETIKNSDTGQLNVWMNGKLTPVDTTTASTWGLPVDYTRPTSILSLLPADTTTTISKYVSSSSGTKYLLDGKRKFALSNTQASQLAGTPTFGTVTDALLNRFAMATLSGTLRQSSSPTVYQQTGGKLYHIYSERDLYGLGYSPASITVLTAAPASLFTDSGGSVFANGHLVRADGTAPVYLVDGFMKMHHIPSETMMRQYGFSFGDVTVVSSLDLSTYTQSSDLGQLATDSGGTLWVVDSGCKQKLPSSLLTAYGLISGQFALLDSAIINPLRQCSDLTNLIRANGQPQVYKVDGGSRHWVTTETAFYQNGFSWPQVRVLSPDFVNAIPTGSTI